MSITADPHGKPTPGGKLNGKQLAQFKRVNEWRQKQGLAPTSIQEFASHML